MATMLKIYIYWHKCYFGHGDKQTNNRVNLVQVCSLNIEQSRLLQNYLNNYSYLWNRETSYKIPPQKGGIELSPQQLRSKAGPRKNLLLHNDRDDKIDLRHSLTFRYQGNLRFYHLPADKSLLMCLLSV